MSADLPPLPPLAANADYRDYATSYALAARAPLEGECERLRAALSAILSSSMCDPGKGKVTAGRWVTINARAEHVSAARAALEPK